jgi:trigger factor
MNISQEKTGSLGAIVKINIDPEDYQPRVDKAIKDQAKKAKIPGFRPGMVPPSHIKKMYGKSILVDEINNLLSDTLNKYIEDENLNVLGRPLPKMEEHKHYNWDFTDKFEFDYELGLAPDFNADFSSADKLTRYVIKADEETLASRIKNIRRSYGKMTNPDVSAGDDVLYSELQQLSPDGSVFEDGIVTTTSVRLDQIQDDEIKGSLTGLKKGDEVTLDIQKAFADDAAKVAGLLKIDEETAADLKSNFRLTVKNVNRLEESDLNQEFFDKLFGEGEVTTEEQFRTHITAEVEGMMAQDSERRLQEDIYKYALDKVQLNLPDDFLKRWLKASDEKMSDEDLETGYNEFAQNLKWTLIGNKIIKDNNIEIKYEDVLETAKMRLAQQFRMYSQVPISEEQIAQYAVQYLQKEENANKIFEEVKAVKVFNYIKSVVTLEPKELTSKEFEQLFA